DVRVARMRQHLGKVRDLAVCPEDFGTCDDADDAIREILLELANGDKRGVAQRADAEEDLVFTGILLRAVAGEGGVHLMIEAADRLQNADAGREDQAFPPPAFNKRGGTP